MAGQTTAEFIKKTWQQFPINPFSLSVFRNCIRPFTNPKYTAWFNPRETLPLEMNRVVRNPSVLALVPKRTGKVSQILSESELHSLTLHDRFSSFPAAI